MAIYQPLDLQYWLVNVFSGSTAIFIAIALAAIGIMAAKFRMNNLLLGVSIGLFMILMNNLAGKIAVGIIGGIIFAYQYFRPVKN